MYIVLLKFSNNKSQAAEFMQDHKDWIKRGFHESIFLMVGSLKLNMGGCIIANNTSLEKLEVFINEDPFVSKNIVTAEIMEVSVSQTGKHLDFLLD